MKYAYSIKTTRVKETDFPYAGNKITGAGDVVNFAHALQNADIEKFICLYLDAQNKIICLQMQTGTVNQANVYPREIMKHALLSNTCALILVHNHPSGNTKPSPEDEAITRRIKEAAKLFDIKVLDHIIITENSYLSFQEAGLI